MKLTKKEAEEFKIVSDAVYKLTQGMAILGDWISKSLVDFKNSNQLNMDLPEPGTPIKFVYEKIIGDQTDNDNPYLNSKCIPTKGTAHAAAYDLRAYIPPVHGEDLGTNILYPGDTQVISTNLIVELPIDFELIVTPRSGLSVKGITVANSPGTIDADYRGVIGVILRNDSTVAFTVTHGDRIAQCKLKRVEPTDWIKVDKLSDTARGSGGFGSTGVK
jgi:dUTP pyrophosphatase